MAKNLTPTRFVIGQSVIVSADRLPLTTPGDPRRMAISTRPQDWTSPVRELLFGIAGPGGAEGSRLRRGVAST